MTTLDIQSLLASLPPQIREHIHRLEHVRQDFVANVSHELRTPLTVIHGYLEILLDEKNLDETHAKIFSQMHQQTIRMETLIENLLLLSRLESGEVEFLDEVDVVELLNTILHEAVVLSNESNHKIILKADKTISMKGHYDELRSLFSNLIFNAIKYTPANGTITVSWGQKNNKKYFSVQDTGIGIAAKDIPRLTERFYRVDPSRTRESGGTGLGLAIVKHILIRHHGQLQIESELGKGSKFTCIFPS